MEAAVVKEAELYPFRRSRLDEAYIQRQLRRAHEIDVSRPLPQRIARLAELIASFQPGVGRPIGS
jgi:hypothetical protein